MRPSPILLLVVLAGCSAANKQASNTQSPAPAASADGTCPLEVGTPVLATEFTSAGERADIQLIGGCRYYAETDVSGIKVQLRARTSGTQLPYIGELMSGGVQGGSTWEIRATTTGDFQIWATGSTGGRAVRVTVTARGSISPKE